MLSARTSCEPIDLVLVARKQLLGRLIDVELSIRGILRGFGLKIGVVTRKGFEGRIRELVTGHITLERIAGAMLSARATLKVEYEKLHKTVLTIVREDAVCRRPMTVPSVDPLVAITYKSAMDDPNRIAKSKAAGALFGLTPKKYQSGEKDVTGGITRAGDEMARTALYEAANVLLARITRFSKLKRRGMDVAKRRGSKRAKVARARKIAVILHRMCSTRHSRPVIGRIWNLPRRKAFPDWKPADEKGDEAQLLPPLHNGETAQLHDPKIEDKETRPSPRYNEGTLIEAMQNAWRFVDDEVLRERLKEAKGIGTPATRAEIIGGLKKQGFLIAEGKHIVPTEAGLSLFGVLKQADPTLVDPGLTAQLECLLDDVVVGKQEMVGAIDAVCNVAERIISKLKEGGAAGGPPLLGATVGNGQPTPAMKRFADSLARQNGIKPPPGYKTSISICRKFLSEHASKKAEGEMPAKLDSKPVSPAQMLYAKKIAQGKGLVIPEEAKANSAAMSAWIDSNRSAKRRKRGRKTAYKLAGSVAPRPTATTKRSRKRKPDASAAPLAPARPNSVTGTPLRIPYGNKEVALKFGARYRSGAWYAPPGVDLSSFRERGWL